MYYYIKRSKQLKINENLIRFIINKHILKERKTMLSKQTKGKVKEMKTSVTKVIKFETAHQLTEAYSEICKQIHGHSYKAEITFENDIDPETGMIIDFKQMKEILQTVVDKYDHKFFTKETFGGLNPTAENMAMDIFKMVKKQYVFIKKVKLWETDTCFCEVGY